MEDTYGCNLINTKRDGRQVTEFVGRYHVHILVRPGQNVRWRIMLIYFVSHQSICLR